ncbi:GGDEF domain-containing protein [Cellulomonas fimi]|uniref:GGDEF domain-containing protein n=1 Tax=Cellulomonas fimi TaxID=1708 RepID=A0A7Y0QGM1_CELFI|nr:GGDEF domain-containing protein [Cellulomonas fimi]NMR20266.1 GGDEF domain-containing protein [Cellulomonas fimi]
MRRETRDVSRNATLVVRRASTGTLLSAVMILGYLASTWGDPNRPLMVVGVVVLLVAAALTLWGVGQPRARPVVVQVGPVLAVLTLALYALLAYLDGGVASPLGVVPYAGMTLMAIVVSRHWLQVYVLWTVLLYVIVAVLGGPAPPGHAAVFTVAFVMLATVCFRHAQALRSLRRRLAVMADVDPLTGCLNRGAFDRRLDQELARAARTGQPVTLVLLDLDGFKGVNDAHGHGVGDAVLRWTGTTLRDAVRSHDVVGRIGGDEFAVVLTGSTHSPATVTERLRELLATQSPASVGYATAPSGGGDAETLRRRADERLYADKVLRGRAGHVRRPAPTVPRTGTTELVVSRFERRRHAVTQTGWLSAFCFLVGAFYAVLAERAAVVPLLVLSIVGVGLGLGAVLTADWLARSARTRRYLAVFTALATGTGALYIVLDGGIESSASLGMLATIPLVALSAPRRSAIPIIGTMAGAYLVIALVQGVSDPWRPAVTMLAFLSLAFACGLHGRDAAVQRRRLTELSRHDALTGTLNRRGFDDELAAALSRVDRLPAPLSLLVLDLDGFKAVNDTHGHAAGDDLLRWVGEQLRATVRAGDSVGRLGGDEFAVLLVDCGADDAALLAERLQALLGERTRCSTGTATLGRDGGDPEALYLRADQQLYAAKRQRQALGETAGRGPVTVEWAPLG